MYQSDITKVTRTTEAVGFPDVVLIDNFNACDLRCSMCDHKNIKKYRKIQRMDWQLYTKIIDEIAVEKPSARVWEIFFGEPFICVDMADRIKYAKRQGLKDVVLNTNGVRMTYDKARAVIEAGLDSIHIGIDAVTPETYNKIRIGGNYDAVVKNTLAYRDLLKEVGHPKQTMFVQMVASDLNFDEQIEFERFWLDKGVGVKIRPMVSWAGLVDATNLSASNQEKRKPCYWLMRTINICADGLVALCSCDVHCRVECGDTNKQSIKEIWNSGLAVYRELHKEGRWDKLPPLCRDCRDWQSTYSEMIN